MGTVPGPRRRQLIASRWSERRWPRPSAVSTSNDRRRGRALSSLPVSAALAWVILVDRTTITGATRNPDDSIENIWFERAALGAFGDLMIVLGLGAAAFAVFGLDIAPALLLSALFVLASADFAVRYLRISKAEG